MPWPLLPPSLHVDRCSRHGLQYHCLCCLSSLLTGVLRQFRKFNRSILFLGMLVDRKGSKATTSVYRKPTNTIHLVSHHHPRVIIRNFIDKANNICMDQYPKFTIRKVLHANRSLPTTTITDGTRAVGGLFHIVGTRASVKILRDYATRAIFKSENTLRKSLMKVKGQRPEETINGVVFEVPCAKCNHIYIWAVDSMSNEK